MVFHGAEVNKWNKTPSQLLNNEPTNQPLDFFMSCSIIFQYAVWETDYLEGLIVRLYEARMSGIKWSKLHVSEFHSFFKIRKAEKNWAFYYSTFKWDASMDHCNNGWMYRWMARDICWQMDIRVGGWLEDIDRWWIDGWWIILQWISIWVDGEREGEKEGGREVGGIYKWEWS